MARRPARDPPRRPAGIPRRPRVSRVRAAAPGRRRRGVEDADGRATCADATRPISTPCRASSVEHPEQRRARGVPRASCSRMSSIARCKVILKPDIFALPRAGTFVLHPGICPEYRNAHGCFWALANRDLDRVGMTLLRVDAGVDTGPVYLHGTLRLRRGARVAHRHSTPRCRREPRRHRTDPDCPLPRRARGPDHDRRPALGRWGQPRLTHYLRWKRAARRRARCDDADRIPAVS